MSTSDQAHRLNQRINSAARNSGMTVDRLRHRITFQRVLARLALGQSWVLKGGFSLEMRLGTMARATKDLDLWRVSVPISDPLDIQDVMQEALDVDAGDGFSFLASTPRRMDIPDAEPSTWRVHVKTFFYGSLFSETVIDVVAADAVAAVETEPLAIEPELIGGPFTISAIDLDRHAAEKYHACVRIYANNRASTRVKDLVDLVLLIEGGWLHAERVGAALVRVFRERNNSQPPPALPDRPPQDWLVTYPRLAVETGAAVQDALDGWALASRFYAQALALTGA